MTVSSNDDSQYCGLTNCWEYSQIVSHDEQGYPIHACSQDHKVIIAKHRIVIYIRQDTIQYSARKD